jgi:signal transduction histidine kinase
VGVVEVIRGHWRPAAEVAGWSVLAAPVVIAELNRGAVLGAAVAASAMLVAAWSARRAPIIGLVIVVLGTLVDGNFAFAVPVLSYLVGLRTSRLRPVVLVFVAITVSGTVLNLGLLRIGPAQWFVLAMTLLVIGVFPWLAGRYRAQQALLVSAGWERAARLEYERRMVARQAQLRERARIAQEMHDSLGHELSLIALSAGALETTSGVPGEHRAAAARIRETAATATDRLREVIGVLRDEDAPAPLEPAGEPVEALVTRASESGMPVRLRHAGVSASRPPAVARTAYQVIREALTNASRHSPGAATAVVVTGGDASTTVSVTNEPSARTPVGTPAGTGLIGLRERVRLIGGTLTAGPTPDGGFRLLADLPHAGRPLPLPLDSSDPPSSDSPAVDALRVARRRAGRSLAAAVLVPAALALVGAVGYYTVAVSHAELSGTTFDRMSLGTPRADLATSLPDRQAWGDTGVPLPPSPPGANCEFYTDGNFPLAQPRYRLCFADGRLTAKDRLR